MTLRAALEPLPRDAWSIQRTAAALALDDTSVRRLLREGLLQGYACGSGKKRPRLRVYVDSIVAYQESRPIAGTALPPAGPKPPAAPRPRVGAAHREAMAALQAAGIWRQG